MQPAGSNRFGAVANHLAAIQKFCDERMRLEPLKLRMWIDQRIAIVETGNVAEIQNPILHSVDPAAAVRPLIGWKAERVRHAPRRIASVRQFPELFDAE